MSVSKVAYRYAQALLDLSEEQKVTDKINEDMTYLHNVCVESKDFTNLLSSPIVDAKKKSDVFKALFETKMDKMSFGFLDLIVKNQREGLIAEIAEGFVKLYRKNKNILDVAVTSAVPLNEKTRAAIIAKINDKFNGTIELTEKVDPELIGGFVVRMDDQQIDASIASQLSNLKNILLN